MITNNTINDIETVDKHSLLTFKGELILMIIIIVVSIKLLMISLENKIYV